MVNLEKKINIHVSSKIKYVGAFLIFATTFVSLPVVHSFLPNSIRRQIVVGPSSSNIIMIMRDTRRRQLSFMRQTSKDDESIEDLWLLDDDDEDNDDEDDEDDEDIDFNIPSSSEDHVPVDIPENEANSIQNVEAISKSTKSKTKDEENSDSPVDKKSQKFASTIPIDMNRTVGVGRYGYNFTTFHNVEYEVRKYFPANDKISYQIRLELLRDYYNKHGDVNVPFRYSCDSFDYGIDRKRKDSYRIALGRWLHTVRKKYETNKEQIPEEFKQELDQMGMNWDGVGAGSRPSTFRKRCKQLRVYVDKNGNDRVPLYGKDRSLGMWVERVKVLYRKLLEGGDCGEQLTDQRIDMLDKAGFDLKSLADKTSNEKHNHRQRMFDKQWIDMYEKLKGFGEEHGHFDVKVVYGTSDFSSLLCWLTEQKIQHEIVRDAFVAGAQNVKSILTPGRYKDLSTIGFNFTMDSGLPLPWKDTAKYNFNADIMMDLLIQYSEESGTCELTLGDVYSHEDPTKMLELYSFKRRLRWEHRHRNLHHLKTIDWLLHNEACELSSQLNDLGFPWFDDTRPTATDAVLEEEYEWWELYHDFLRYREANGDSKVETDGLWYSDDLADWFEQQKMEFSSLLKVTEQFNDDHEGGHSVSMTEWHFSALKNVGFDVNTTKRVALPNLVGRRPAVLSLEADLENEVDDLPKDLKSPNSGAKKVDKAEQLAWLVRYASLRRYYSKNGSGALSNISSDDKNGQRLAFWANNQRKQYSNFVIGKKSTITKRRIGMLDDIGFDWELKRPGGETEWEEMKQDLIDFKDQFDHCFVPASFRHNTRLGQWVLLQRQLYQQSKRRDLEGFILPTTLTKKKEQELLSIGLDLTMDNLAFGNMAYEIVSWCF